MISSAPIKERAESRVSDQLQGTSARAPSVYPPRLRVALVCNPKAGSYSPAKLERLQRAFEGRQYLVHRYDGMSFKIDRLTSPIDLICIAGGDGTVRTTIGNNQSSEHPPPYCVFPMGTINLVAREAGYRPDIAKFCADSVVRTGDRTHVAGRVGNEVFLCCASIGPDSHAVARLSPRLKDRLGRFAYVVAMLKLGWSWPRPSLNLEIDGARHSAEAVFVLKGRYYAGPWVLDNQASLTKDCFRVLLLPQARRRDFLRLALFAIFGSIFADPRWTRLDASVVDISSPVDLPIQADGDIVAMTPARITLDPRPLTFLCGFRSQGVHRGR